MSSIFPSIEYPTSKYDRKLSWHLTHLINDATRNNCELCTRGNLRDRYRKKQTILRYFPQILFFSFILAITTSSITSFYATNLAMFGYYWVMKVILELVEDEGYGSIIEKHFKYWQGFWEQLLLYFQAPQNHDDAVDFAHKMLDSSREYENEKDMESLGTGLKHPSSSSRLAQDTTTNETGSISLRRGYKTDRARMNDNVYKSACANMTQEEEEGAMNWMEIGKNLGIRLLNSETVSRVINVEDEGNASIAEKCVLMDDEDIDVNALDVNILSKERVDEKEMRIATLEDEVVSSGIAPVKPKNPMWTSGSNTFTGAESVDGDLIDDEDVVDDTDGLESAASTAAVPVHNARVSITDDFSLPPLPTCNGGGLDDRCNYSLDARQHKSKEVHEFVPLLSGKSIEIICDQEADSGVMSTSSYQSSNMNVSFCDDSSSMLSVSKLSSVLSGCKRESDSSVKNSFRSRLQGKMSKNSMQAPIGESIEMKFSESTKQTPKGIPLQRSRLTKLRRNLVPGMKVVVSIFPYSARSRYTQNGGHLGPHEMATVVSCDRISILASSSSKFRGKRKNCLSIRAVIDNSYLRDGKFATVNMRIPDGTKMPKHSAFPIGSSLATSFGLGVLVAWRVEDDIHVITSLWNKRGGGSAVAYLRRSDLHGQVEAPVGFQVDTSFGKAKTIGYVNSETTFLHGKYCIILENLRNQPGERIFCDPKDILSCPSVKFVPICEQIRDACHFQIQVDAYRCAINELSDISVKTTFFLWTESLELLISSFVKAIDENTDIDREVGNFMSGFIKTVEKIGAISDADEDESDSAIVESSSSESTTTGLPESLSNPPESPDGFWLVNDLLGGVFQNHIKFEVENSVDRSQIIGSMTAPPTPPLPAKEPLTPRTASYYEKSYAILKILKRAVSIASVEASAAGLVDLTMALYVVGESLHFINLILKVRRMNVTKTIEQKRSETMKKIVDIFVPMHEKVSKIGHEISERMKSHRKKARIKLGRFFEIILKDDQFFDYLEKRDWQNFLFVVRDATIAAKIMSRDSFDQLYQSGLFVFSALAPRKSKESSPKETRDRSFALFAFVLKWSTHLLAAPKRSLLKLLASDMVQDFAERILVRVFQNAEEVSNALNIYASTFRSIRHIRILKNLEIAGSMWIPILNSMNEEFGWNVSRMPESTREYGSIIAKLFTLGVMHFHLVRARQAHDWYGFLFEDEAVQLISLLDLKIVNDVESFCNELKETVEILPYYASIDEDLLTFLDGVELDKVLKEAALAIRKDDFTAFLRKKSEITIDHFLEYLPKMHIPIEKRDIGDGWILTCRGMNGKDLQLSMVKLKRDNLVCRILGSSNLLAPLELLTNDTSQSESAKSTEINGAVKVNNTNKIQVSILDNICELLLNAQRHECWEEGIGGVGIAPTSQLAKDALHGLHVSSVLNCAIRLWEDMEIDDDELMEIAIRDVSYQIKLRKEKEEKPDSEVHMTAADEYEMSGASLSSTRDDGARRRFNPRKDPTVIYLELTGLSCHLENFTFRLEPKDQQTQWDPVFGSIIFQGTGSLKIEDAAIKLRMECCKERVQKLKSAELVPVLRLEEFDLKLHKVHMEFKETGFDWLLNKVISGFRDVISGIVEQNIRHQVLQQIHDALEHVNAFIEVNSDIVLKLLGITIEDLDENVAWV